MKSLKYYNNKAILFSTIQLKTVGETLSCVVAVLGRNWTHTDLEQDLRGGQRGGVCV